MSRGTNPQPGAITYFQSKQFKVFDSQLLADVRVGLPGEIIDITEAGFAVAATDGAVLVKRVQVKSLPKIAAAEFARQANLKVGERLG